MTVTVTSNSSGSARDLAVGSAETFRAKCNVTGVANVSTSVDTVPVGSMNKTLVDDATEVTCKAGKNSFVLSCEIGPGGSVVICEGACSKTTTPG